MNWNKTVEKFKKELKDFQKTIIIIVAFITIVFWGIAYGLSYYSWTLWEQKKVVARKNATLNSEITELQDELEKFLQWRRIEDLKKTEEALTNYFITRLTLFPKILVLEFIEEITPPEIKYNDSLSIGKDMSISMKFFTKTIEEIGEYYYRLRYYEELWLLEINNFKQVELTNPKKGDLKKYGLKENTKYIFETNIDFKLKIDALKEYYNLILDRPEYISLIKDYILIKNPIEPLTIPENIGLEDVKKAHSILKERIEKAKAQEEERINNIGVNDDEDFSDEEMDDTVEEEEE